MVKETAIVVENPEPFFVQRGCSSLSIAYDRKERLKEIQSINKEDPLTRKEELGFLTLTLVVRTIGKFAWEQLNGQKLLDTHIRSGLIIR